jgi:serine/threonine protein kinase
VSEEQTRSYAGETQPISSSPSGSLLESFGPYRLLKKIGEGGMGVVYHAVDLRNNREVALKVPRQDRAGMDIILPRFYREGRLAARLAHPNLCPVLEVGEIDGTHYLSMPFIKGRRLLDGRPASLDAAARLIHTLALALHEAHRQHIIHRDIKPSNILIDEQDTPIIVDFGLAVCLGEGEERLTLKGDIVGTIGFMAPEQFVGQPDLVGPHTDIYALGALFYWLLTERAPRPGVLASGDESVNPPPPSSLKPGLSPRHDAVCLRALAPRVTDRFASMLELADAVAELAGLPRRQAPPRPPVSRQAIRFAFVGHGETALRSVAPRDRIYLDVGNALGPGVIDHHHLAAGTSSTTSLVLAHPSFLDGALRLERKADEPVTVVLHREPDLDGVCSAYLAIVYLTSEGFPRGSEVLARYIDELDAGAAPLSQANPFTLYAAYHVLANRLLKRSWNTPQECWQEQARLGLQLVEFVLSGSLEHQIPLPAVDAFACADLFGPDDRQEVMRDLQRYRAKLADPHCHAQRSILRLPGAFAGPVEVEALLVRDVQNDEDPQRCIFFKHWARTDTQLCPTSAGFVALSVFSTESTHSPRRCILSVRPGCGASLRGLGARLDEMEAQKRQQIHGVDDRAHDPLTGEPRRPRPGYGNADPWYDGRSHDYTIIDSPRSGTLLSADEIEQAFLVFGAALREGKAPAAALAPLAPASGERGRG